MIREFEKMGKHREVDRLLLYAFKNLDVGFEPDRGFSGEDAFLSPDGKFYHVALGGHSRWACSILKKNGEKGGIKEMHRHGWVSVHGLEVFGEVNAEQRRSLKRWAERIKRDGNGDLLERLNEEF